MNDPEVEIPSCLHCGRAMTGDSLDMISDGVAFTALGNYGSTIFDPFDGSQLLIVICDNCLWDASNVGQVMFATRPSRPAREWSPWETGESVRPDTVS